MNLEEQAIENLRNHKLNVIESNQAITFVEFGIPGESNGRMFFIFTHNNNVVTIFGDYYDGIYRWYGENKTFEFFTKIELDYMMGKCDAESRRSSLKEFDYRKTKSNFFEAAFEELDINNAYLESLSTEELRELMYTELISRDCEYDLPMDWELDSLLSAEDYKSFISNIRTNQALMWIFNDCPEDYISDSTDWSSTAHLHHQALKIVGQQLHELNK